MVRCGFVNPGASGSILYSIEEKLRDFDDRRDHSLTERLTATELLIEELAAELRDEIQRVLEVECDIGWQE